MHCMIYTNSRVIEIVKCMILKQLFIILVFFFLFNLYYEYKKITRDTHFDAATISKLTSRQSPRANRAQIYNYYLLASNNRIWRCLSLAMLRRVIRWSNTECFVSLAVRPSFVARMTIKRCMYVRRCVYTKTINRIPAKLLLQNLILCKIK